MENGGLIPYLDLINTSQYPNCILSSDQNHLILTALENIKNGEELTINYLNDDIYSLFLNYGVVLNDYNDKNIHNYYLLAVDSKGFEISHN